MLLISVHEVHEKYVGGTLILNLGAEDDRSDWYCRCHQDQGGRRSPIVGRRRSVLIIIILADAADIGWVNIVQSININTKSQSPGCTIWSGITLVLEQIEIRLGLSNLPRVGFFGLINFYGIVWLVSSHLIILAKISYFPVCHGGHLCVSVLWANLYHV